MGKEKSSIAKGLYPKTLEPQCLVGVPLPNGKAPDEDIQKAVEKFFDRIILPYSRDIIGKQSKIVLDKKGEL